ncbi:MAG: hypothetical protein KF805_17285, partial [Phycisphaeraceae bacterium]|nr:hypothetical protein [Phycisphaeraceae bacterium]
ENGVPRYSLWSTASREVFAEVESTDRLARLWNLIVPLLPWIGALLLALIPMALLWWMLRNDLWRRRLGRLSLLAQCLLISLLIHAAITAGLAVWKVGSGIAEAVRSGSGTRVVLASSGAAGELGGQLRAGATQTPSVMPVLAAITTESSLRASIDRGPAIDLPPVAMAVPAKLAMPTDSGAEEQPTPMESPSVPTSVPEIHASVPAAAREASASEAPMKPARMDAPSPASPALRGEIRVPDVALPQSDRATSERRDASDVAGMAALRLQESLSRADDGAGTQDAPVQKASALGDAAPLPQAQGTKANEAKISAPASELRIASAAPALTLSAGSAPALVPLPRMPDGNEASRLPRSVVESATLTNPEAAPSFGRAERLEAGKQTVTARLPATATPRGEGVTRAQESEHASLRRPERLPSQLSAPIGMSALKGVETSFIPLPSSDATGMGERMPTSGFGAQSAPERVPSLGGAVIDSSLLGSATIGGSPLPADIAEPVKPVETFEQRQPESRGELLAKMGGSAETEKAVGLALEWFARHQEADGHWSGKNFDAHCGRCSAPAQIDADAAMTGIVLLCYLGAGHTHVAEGPYREPIERALKWLVDRQAPSGDLRRGETMYGQTLSTVALCEALAMTKDQKLAGPTRRAVDFVLRTAAARGGATREEDTSVLGWLVMTVESARRAGIAVPRDVFDAAGRWLESASSAG